jgi:Calx-beta domain
MSPRSFRPQLEELGSRTLPSANPAISISDVAVAEGNSGQTAFVFTVSLSEVSSKVVSVRYGTAHGSATSGSDYANASGSLIFAPGETTKTITVLVNGDTVAEADETFVINLSGSRNAVIADAQGLGTIVNDDHDDPVAVVDPVYGTGGDQNQTGETEPDTNLYPWQF